MSDPITPAVVAQPDRRIACAAGLRPVAITGCKQIELWVRSPKTGHEVVIGDGFFPQLRERASRIIGRIAQARSQGRAAVDLTVAELQAIAEVAKLIDEKTKPLPRPKDVALPQSWMKHRRPRFHRRGW